jgi:hypothetical protein
MRNRPKTDYTGKRFGLFVVIGFDSQRSKPRKVYWKCKCDCGKEFSIRQDRFKTQRSCGCIRAESLVIGQTFGRLTVLEIAHDKKTHNQGVCFKCQCACGNIHYASLMHLNSGAVRSCGCLLKESATLFQTTHGKSKTRLFRIWSGMKQRCTNPIGKDYSKWGGRGIRVCDEWIADFMNFYSWAITNCYSEHLSLDRKDNDGNYEPSNCKWSTPLQQQNNSRLNKSVIINNKYFNSLSSVAREYGISYHSILNHYKSGNLEEYINNKM